MQSVVLQFRHLSLNTCNLLRTGPKLSSCQIWDVSSRHNRTSDIKIAGSSSVLVIPSVSMSFFNAPDANQLWSAQLGVSSQGKKRGRARGMMKRKNLNKGQVIGMGPEKITFPGLTSNTTTGKGPVIKKNTMTSIDENQYQKYEDKLVMTRDMSLRGGMRRRLLPLERGWCGGKAAGRKFGPPIATNQDYSFDNFDSILLEFKTVFHMTGNMGRLRRTSALMVTGNRNGTFGYSLTAGKYGKNLHTFKSSVNKAGLRLMTIDRYEDRTVFHDFFSQYGKTRIFVEQRPFGFGVTAHRGIKAICDMVGIKDLYAKVEGSVNIQSITKAFILGLLRQKTHQQLADEKQLHLIEMRPEEDNYPRLVASPSDGKVRSQSEIGHNEQLDFDMICYEGHMPATRPEKKNPYEGTPGWDKYLRKSWALEHHTRVRRRMRIENGDQLGAVRSYLYEKYPECIEMMWKEEKQRLPAKDRSKSKEN